MHFLVTSMSRIMGPAVKSSLCKVDNGLNVVLIMILTLFLCWPLRLCSVDMQRVGHAKGSSEKLPTLEAQYRSDVSPHMLWFEKLHLSQHTNTPTLLPTPIEENHHLLFDIAILLILLTSAASDHFTFSEDDFKHNRCCFGDASAGCELI